MSWASDLPIPSKFPIRSLHGGGMDIFWNHTIYFENSERRTVYTVSQVWTPQGFLFSTVFGLVYLLNWLTVCDKISAKTAESSLVNKLYVALGQTLVSSRERSPGTLYFLSTQNSRNFGWLIKSMERSISVWSDRNIRDQLWRWSTLTGLVILVGRTEVSLSVWQNCCP